MRGPFFYGHEGGDTWQHGLFALLIVLAIAAAIVLLVRMWLASRPNLANRPTTVPPAGNPAITELDLRYARGEITREEFLQRRADLLGHIAPPGAVPPGTTPPGAPPAA